MKASSLRAAFHTACSGLLIWLVFPALPFAAELQVGTASVDITPLHNSAASVNAPE